MFKKNIKKIDIIKNLNNRTGLSLSLSKKIIDDLIIIICQNIKTGECLLKNIGSFKVINKKERLGRNPNTKQEFIIKSRKSVSFKPSEKIIKEINN